MTGGRWAMSPSCPQRAPKAQTLALPLNEHACSSLERERIPMYCSVKGQAGETLSLFVCVTQMEVQKHISHTILRSVPGEPTVVSRRNCSVLLLWLLLLLGSDERLSLCRVSAGFKCVGVIRRPDGLSTVKVDEKERFEDIKERLRVILENQIVNFR